MIESHEFILYKTQPVILKRLSDTQLKKIKMKIKQTFASCSLKVTIDFVWVSFLFERPISITTDDGNSNNEHENELCIWNNVSWKYQS